MSFLETMREILHREGFRPSPSSPPTQASEGVVIGSVSPTATPAPTEAVTVEPAAENPRPVYWERADLSIVGPGRPEFLAKVGSGPKASYWVVALYEGQPVWINSMQLRSKRQFEQQRTPCIVELAKDLS